MLSVQYRSISVMFELHPVSIPTGSPDDISRICSASSGWALFFFYTTISHYYSYDTQLIIPCFQSYKDVKSMSRLL